MDCQDVTPELFGYHFGTLDEPRRSAVDEHLLGCAGCLRQYQRLKHALDGGGLAAPDPRVKARLRAAVMARTSSRGLTASARRVLSRPIPLYQGLAAACVAAAVALALSWAPRGAPAPSLGPDGAKVDSARPPYTPAAVL